MSIDDQICEEIKRIKIGVGLSTLQIIEKALDDADLLQMDTRGFGYSVFCVSDSQLLDALKEYK